MDLEDSNYPTLGCANKASSLYACMRRWYREDLSHVLKWRKEAREDFDFYNGDQWSEEDKQRLRAQNRPCIVFNKISPLVNAIVGSERNNKRDVRFIPRQVGKSLPNDLLTGACEWFRDLSNAEYSDSEAFRDMVVCGMGWTETSLDSRDNPDGDPSVRYLDPLKMVWDCNASEVNLIDARRLWYVERKPVELAQELFPGIAVSDLHASWAYTGQIGTDDDTSTSGYERDYVTLVECRWFEDCNYYKSVDIDVMRSLGDIDEDTINSVVMGSDVALRDYSEEEFDSVVKELGFRPRNVSYCKRVARRAFLGNGILGEIDSPLCPPNQLGWECITGYHNKSERHFYGIVRATKDPQRWSNKYFSQIMNILNSQAKGGIFAERGAFENEYEMARSYARADAITVLRDGALAAGKIQPKPKAEYPSGFFQLFQISNECINDVTGLSPEFIGTREVNQAGILEAQRRQSSLNLLASLFDALRLYRLRQGRIILHLIQNYLSDGRLIRVMGEEHSEYIELTRDKVTSYEYDIIVDDAPTSPNEKERTFANLMQLMPVLQNVLTPEIVLDLMKYSPLPSSLLEQIKQKIAVQQQQMMALQQQQLQQQPQTGEMEQALKLDGLTRDMDAKQAMNDLKLQGQQVDIAMKLSKMLRGD